MPNNPHELTEEVYNKLKLYLDEEIEGMAGYSGKMLPDDELFQRLLNGLDRLIAQELATAHQQGVEAERTRIHDELVSIWQFENRGQGKIDLEKYIKKLEFTERETE